MTRINFNRCGAAFAVVVALVASAGCDDGDSNPPAVDGGLDANVDAGGGGPTGTGIACTADSECGGTNPDCITGLYPLMGLPDAPAALMTVGVALPGGYCSTVAPCANDAECATGGKCFRPLADVPQATIDSLAVALGSQANADYFHTYGACLDPCEADTDCRAGYVCAVPLGEVLVAVPGSRQEKYCVGAP